MTPHVSWVQAPADLLSRALEVTALDLVKAGVSVLALGLLWWPFVLAAVAGVWFVFEKAGRPGWAGLVPGYGAVQLMRIAKSPGWWALLLLVPGVNVAVFAVACGRLARAFGKGPRFAAGLVLLPPVFLALLGMGEARYRRFDVIAGARTAEEPEPAGGALRARLAAVP